MKYLVLIMLLLNMNEIAWCQSKSKKPSFRDSTITVRLSRTALDYFKQNNINISTAASQLLENSSRITIDSNTLKIVSEKILADDGFEVTYSDGSKKITYSGGFTMVNPDGKTRQFSMMQVSAFAPPSPPSGANEIKYLQNVSTSLLSLLSDLLNNDATSIANFKLGDANLDLYQIINRRLRFIDYVTSKK